MNWENLIQLSDSQLNYQEKAKRRCYLFAKKNERNFTFGERQLEATKPGVYLLEEFHRTQILNDGKNQKILENNLKDAFTIDPGVM